MKYLALMIELTSFSLISLAIWIVVWIAKSRSYESFGEYLETLPKGELVPASFLVPVIELLMKNIFLLVVILVVSLLLLIIGVTIGNKTTKREAQEVAMR